MAITMSAAAYGAVIVGGLALFAIGHPAGEPPPSPTTPGLIIASAVPPAAAVATVAPTSVTAAGFTLTSTVVDLPSSERTFPAGPGMDVTQQSCTACHSVGMVMNQPNLPRATWDAEVHKMLATYKAPFDPADIPAIVAYLASIKGTDHQ
jgi:mono/diheme cytochrome c family protein